MDDLKMELIEITGVDLVEKGKEPNKWKEYDVKIANYVKGTKYSIPIKKKDGEYTAAYNTYKALKDKWEENFLEDKSVEIGVACSVKLNNWDYKGTSGTTTYKTIRFFKDPTETRNELSKTDAESVREKTVQVDEDPINLTDIPF